MTIYAPTASQIPGERFILFVDSSEVVQQFDESTTDDDGTSITGTFETPNLVHGDAVDRRFDYTLTFFWLQYESTGATTVTLETSVDGGTTWANSTTPTIASSDGLISNVKSFFNLHGDDIRVRISFDTTTYVLIHDWAAELVQRQDIAVP